MKIGYFASGEPPRPEGRMLGATHSPPHPKGRATAIVLLLAIFLALLPAADSTQASGGKIHPQLLALAAAQPNQQVRVIIQHSLSTAEMSASIDWLGGVMVQDLSIIQAVAAKMPAGALPRLATRPSVRWISPDGPVQGSGALFQKPGPKGSTSTATNYFLDTLGVRPIWQMGYQGQGIGVAVIDSGIDPGWDFASSSAPESTSTQSVAVTDSGGTTETFETLDSNGASMSRVVVQLPMNRDLKKWDSSGHGTHVSGIIAGNGRLSGGALAGIAPMANLISLNISDNAGMAYESDTVAALQWVLNNKAAHNIRVVNLSINSTVEGSYHASPLNAAAEILWFNGIVVVASSGNKGGSNGNNTANAAPANDPFLITVGAFDESGDARTNNDTMASFTAHGITQDWGVKPEILAPGVNIWSVLASNSSWGRDYPDRVDSTGKYFRASGTSMAAPMVAGAAALLLQKEPGLTPDQVKFRLMNASRWVGGYRGLDVYKAITTPTTGSANTGIAASQLLVTGSEPVVWNSVNWNSVNWNSVNWNSVNWNSVNWNSVNWNSVYFGN